MPAYQLGSGKELTIGREEHTGLLQFLLDEDGGSLPKALSGKFTSQKFVDEAYRVYLGTAEHPRTREPLVTAFESEEPKKERVPVKYKQPKATPKDS